MPGLDGLLGQLGAPVDDAEEETFVLFAQALPSRGLGFVDPAATALHVSVAGRDLAIHQSPALLSSDRPGGTTGAVVWSITPLVAAWLASADNVLFATSVLSAGSAVLELGCGVSAIVGLALAPRVSRYVLTDQPYVARLVNQNLAENEPRYISGTGSSGGGVGGGGGKARKGKRALTAVKPLASASAETETERILFRPLDWETDGVTGTISGSAQVRSFDAVIACDCVYNEALVEPLVQTCADVCRLRMCDTELAAGQPCVCLVAQQLRDPAVFEAWLKCFCSYFRVWRIPDALLADGLRTSSGFVVHMGLLREQLSSDSAP